MRAIATDNNAEELTRNINSALRTYIRLAKEHRRKRNEHPKDSPEWKLYEDARWDDIDAAKTLVDILKCEMH